MSTGDAVDAFVAAHGADVDDPAAEPELFEGFTDLLFDSAETNAADPTRWSQTSAGWVLREFIRRVPERVPTFVETHPELSTEARRNALTHR